MPRKKADITSIHVWPTDQRRWTSSSECLKRPCPANTSAFQRWEYLRYIIYNATSLTFGKKKQRQWIGLRPTWTRYSLSFPRRGMPLLPTKAHPVTGHCMCLGQPKSLSTMDKLDSEPTLCQCWREGDVPQDMTDAK